MGINYENYAPYRTIILSSQDAIKTLVTKTIETVEVAVCQDDEFNINLGTVDLERCRLAVKSFSMKHNALIVSLKYVGGVYLKNISTLTQYNSGGSANGYLFFTTIFANNDILYNNNDVVHKSMPIVDLNMFNVPLHFYIESNQRDQADNPIGGLIDTENWILELEILKLIEEPPNPVPPL